MKTIGYLLQRHAYELTGWVASLPPRWLFSRLQWRVWAIVRDLGFLIETRRWVPTQIRGLR